MEFPYGEIEPTIPPGVTPPECWPEYVPVAVPVTFCARETIDSTPPGIRWGIWPLMFEQYVTDTEPTPSSKDTGALARNRAVLWKRIHRTDIPKGWYTLSTSPWRVDGFIALSPTEDYRALWHKQPRRDLRLWKEQFENISYRIEKISFDDYKKAYANSTVKKNAGSFSIEALERKYADPIGRAHMQLWGVRNIATSAIVAGISLRFSPSHNSATYEAPFITPEAKKIYAMTALIDRWFTESQQRGIQFLVFNTFWHKGEPKSWKNFSLFKSHFGPRYIAYPPVLWKFVRGKLI